MITLNRRRIALGSELKPYDYEVEYLESTGTQYIDLGYTLKSNTDVVDVTLRLAELGTTLRGAFGCRASASSLNYTIVFGGTNYVIADLNNGNYSTYRIQADSGDLGLIEVHMEQSNKYIIKDGVTASQKTNTSATFETNGNAYLFAMRGSTVRAAIRVYRFSWERDGALLLDLIPVRVGQVGYMYDKVSGQLFGNSGTGTFILGPDVISGG